LALDEIAGGVGCETFKTMKTRRKKQKNKNKLTDNIKSSNCKKT